MKVSILLPARNEEILIKNTVKDVLNYLAKKKYNFEIIIILNGCTDNTKNILLKYFAKEKNVKLMYSNPGYGLALRKGLKDSKGDYVVIFNVDFYDLKILDLIDIDLYGKDFITGSKMAHWSDDKRPVSRKIISSLFNKYLNIAFKFKGSDTHGIKVIRRSVVQNVYKKCKTTSGIFDTEFVLRAQYAGFKFADFPVTVEEKRPPRFTQRLLQTPIDVYNLYTSLKYEK